jgi:hypothetical protein
MTAPKSLHTLNARGNVMLEVMRDHFELTPKHMFREIQGLREGVENALALKGIRYDDLKTALIPDRTRREIALIFDTAAIDNDWHGYEVGSWLLPLFNRSSNHSILAGDYIDNGAGQELLMKAMMEVAQFHRQLTIQHTSQLYIIYVNNLSDTMIENFRNGLLPQEGYIGFADMTYGSLFKTLLSTMLVNAFLKHGNLIIQGHEDDRPNSEDVNMYGYPVEKYGYVCRSIQSMLEGPYSPTRSSIQKPCVKHIGRWHPII